MANPAVNWDEGDFHDAGWSEGSFSDESQQPQGVVGRAVENVKQLGKAAVEHPLQVIPGVAEAVSGFVGGMGTAAISGAAGLVAGAKAAVSGEGFLDPAVRTIEKTQAALEKAFPLQPETEVGKAASNVLGTVTDVSGAAGEHASSGARAAALSLGVSPETAAKIGAVAGTAADVGVQTAAYALGGKAIHAVLPKGPKAVDPAAAGVGSTLASAARGSGMSPDLATAIGSHGEAHATENGVGDLAGHADGAIDRMQDSELQNLSPRYAALRKQGLSESEVKASLKSHFAAAVDAYKPKTKGAADVDEAFGGTGAAGATPEGWGESLIEKPDAGDELVAQLNERAKNASSETGKKILSEQAAAMTEAQALLKDANAAGKAGDAKMRARLLQERAKLFKKHGIDDPMGVAPEAPKPPEPDDSIINAELVPAAPELPAPVRSLPPPSGEPPPPEPTPRPAPAEGAPEAAKQHPGYESDQGRPQVPPGFDVSKSVGLGGGKDKTGKKGYISRMIPPFLDVQDRNGNTVKIPVWDEIASHENGEFPNIAELGYDKAHNEHGNAATAKFLEPYNVDPRAYQNALRPHLKAAELDALQHPDNVPADLDHRVYAKPFAEVDNTHLLGEMHPWNKTHAGKKPVAARAKAREKALKEHADANRDTAQPVSERPVSGQRELQPTAEEANQQRPAEAANESPAAQVGETDASQVRSDQGQAARAGEAPGGGEVQRSGDLQRAAEAGAEAGDGAGEPDWLVPPKEAPRVSAEDLKAGVRPMKDERLKSSEHRVQLKSMQHQGGWAEIGGKSKLSREEVGTSGERAATPWVPHSEEWRRIQTDAPLKNNTSGRATAAAIEKALNGDKMSVAERRHVLRHLQEIDDTMFADKAQAAADEERLARDQADNVSLVRQANELLGEDRVAEIAEKHEDDNEFYSALRREMTNEQHKAEGIPSGEANAADGGRAAPGGAAEAGGEQAGLEVAGGEAEPPRLAAADLSENFAMAREQRTPEQSDAEMRRQAEVAQQDMLGGKTAEAQAAEEAARRKKAENAPDASVGGGLFAKPKAEPAPAWHTPIPEEGLPLTKEQEAGSLRGYEAIPGMIAKDALDAVSRTQQMSGQALYAYYKPAEGRMNGIVRLLPDDQNAPAGWKLLNGKALRPGMEPNSVMHSTLREWLRSAPILGDEKAPPKGEGMAKRGSTQTETPAFKRWFGGSKVVDKSGKPLEVFHGTPTRGTEVFDTGRVTDRSAKGDEPGTYFTSDQRAAGNYTRRRGQPGVGEIVPAYLKIENPLYTAPLIKKFQKAGMSFGDAKREALKSLDRSKHDGIIFKGDGINPDEYVVFKPEQIKSSVSNKGTFDPEDPRIGFQKGRAGEGAGADTVRSELESKHGKPGVQNLEKNGLLNIIHSDDMPAGPDTAEIKADPSIKAYYDGSGKAYLFHDRLDAGEATGALMHELGVHYGARELLGEHGFAKMLDDISALRKGGNKAVHDAWEHVKVNYSHDENSHSFKNEVAARLVETEPEMGFVRKLVTAIKAAIYKKTGITAALDDHVIRKIAADALRSTMDEPHLGRLEQDATEGMFKKDSPQRMREAGQSIGDAIKAVGTTLDGKVSVEQQLGRQGLRAALANVIRADAKVRTKLKGVRDYADRLIGKDPKLARQALEAWETGKPVTDPQLAAFFRDAQKYGDQMVDQIRATGKEMGYIENYLPHLYKDPKRAAEFFYNMSQSRPMRSGGFTKERFHATLEEARKAGLEPVSENPVDLFLAHWSQMHKYVEMAKFKDHLFEHGLLRPEADNRYRMPPGWAKVNDPLFNGLMAPEGVAKDINNHVSPGLDQHALWRGFRSAQNMLLTTRLGASLFHAGMTTVDSFLSHSSIGLQRAMIGDINGAAHSMAKAVGALPQAVTDFFGKGEGSKLVRQFLGVEHVDPTTALIFDKLTRGGARAFMDKTDTNDAIVKFHRAMMQKNGTEMAKAAFGAGVEAMTRNISHKLVPAQKMIARVNLFKLELDRYAEKAGAKRGDYGDIISKMNPDKIDEIAARVNDDVDDRLGQVAYDNLFWNKMVKQAAQASIQSVGWNVGSFRLIFGGLKDIKNLAKPETSALPIDRAGKVKDMEGPRLSSRLAYLLTMNSVLLASNGMLTYLMTGEQPSGKDWWYFRTGAKNADGSDERMALPSYMRDEYGLLNRPLEMVQNKLHPSISMATEMWRNHDYFGDEIRNPLDKWPTQAKQLLSYFAKGIEPYSVQNLQAQTGGGAKDVLPFIGVTKAPGYVNRSDFQQGVMEAAQEQRKSKTPEDRDRSHAVSQAIQAYRSGDQNALKGMDPAEQARIKSMAKNDIIDYHFKSLPLGTMLNLIEKADPKEIKDRKLVQIINHKMLTPSGRAAMKDMQPDERAAVHARLRELGAAQ